MADMRALAQRLVPYLMPLLDEAVRGAVARALQRAPRDTWMPATVVGVQGPLADIIVDTADDEDIVEIQAVIIGTPPVEGDRVMTVHTPPHGRYVLGPIAQTDGL